MHIVVLINQPLSNLFVRVLLRALVKILIMDSFEVFNELNLLEI